MIARTSGKPRINEQTARTLLASWRDRGDRIALDALGVMLLPVAYGAADEWLAGHQALLAGNKALQHDDVRQAASLGLVRAIATWKPGRGCSLAGWAWKLSHDEVVNMARAAWRHCRRAMQWTAPLEDAYGESDPNAELPDELARKRDDVRAAVEASARAMGKASRLERGAYRLVRVRGLSVEQCCGRLAVPRHSVENALTRMRVRVKAELEAA